jgi:hypothetical protein
VDYSQYTSPQRKQGTPKQARFPTEALIWTKTASLNDFGIIFGAQCAERYAIDTLR